MDGLSSSILGHELWNDSTELISGNGEVEVVAQEVSNVQGISSLESTLESGVEGIVGEVSLEHLALWISWGPGGWGVSGLGNILSIEEGAVNNHGEDLVGRDLRTSSHLSEIESNTGKVWNSSLSTVGSKSHI